MACSQTCGSQDEGVGAHYSLPLFALTIHSHYSLSTHYWHLLFTIHYLLTTRPSFTILGVVGGERYVGTARSPVSGFGRLTCTTHSEHSPTRTGSIHVFLEVHWGLAVVVVVRRSVRVQRVPLPLKPVVLVSELICVDTEPSTGSTRPRSAAARQTVNSEPLVCGAVTASVMYSSLLMNLSPQSVSTPPRSGGAYIRE